MKRMLSLSLFALASACSEVPQQGSAPGLAQTDAVASRLEAALADLETGRSVDPARAVVQSLADDASLPKEDRARALVALARSYEKSDATRAVELLERASALGDSAAEKKLFAVLAGREPPSAFARRAMDVLPVAPSAKAFAKYFPSATPDRAVEIDMVSFGGPSRRESDEIGTFAIGEVLRQDAAVVCGNCDEVRTNIHTSSSHEVFWSAIPRYVDRLERALVIVYVDRETLVPERYARYLAAPAADIRAAIERGEGLVAVKDRAGAPPLVTIAAPRPALLRKAEQALAAMPELPKRPTAVKMPTGLEPNEIQQVIRSRFGTYRKCYEALLGARPTAAGRVVYSFTIKNDGSVRDLTTSFEGTLDEPTMKSCMERGMNATTFPAFSSDPSAKVTVVYPVVFSP